MLGNGTIKTNTFDIEYICAKPSWTYIGRPWDDTIWENAKSEPNFDYLDNLKNKNLQPVVDMSIEHWGGESSQCILNTYQLLDKNFANFVVLTHDQNDHQKFPNLFFYPYWYYRTLKYFVPFVTDQLPKKFKVSCLHGRAKFHRIANYLRLVDKSYHDSVWKKINLKDPGTSRPDDYVLPKEILNRWNEFLKNSTIFEYAPVGLPIWHCKDVVESYTNSYVNLVVESSVLPGLFVTEKTWKAIASGQLFLVFGTAHTIDYLRNVGVDTFDDIIDHDYYDQEKDWLTRLDKLHKVLDSLVQQDLDRIWAETYNRRLLNQNKFKNFEFDPGYKNALLNRLS